MLNRTSAIEASEKCSKTGHPKTPIRLSDALATQNRSSKSVNEGAVGNQPTVFDRNALHAAILACQPSDLHL